MTNLDERNGWHVVAEGDVPDTTQDVWVASNDECALSPAYHNRNGWFWARNNSPIRGTVLLWHEIERPEIPQALRESVER